MYKFDQKSFLIIIAAIVCVSQVGLCQYVQYYPCSYNSTQTCTIHRAYITPCPEAEFDDPCLAYRGTNSSISVTFTPKFGGKLSARAYSATFLIDLPFLDMDIDACKYTTCPAVPNVEQTYNYTVNILDIYPVGPYTVKWRIWNEENEECCSMVKIQIV